ncbi:MAG: TolC family protein, partial [Firmicutes bacterium]|nr:TolC family protein [Bacillota bacterium]
EKDIKAPFTLAAQDFVLERETYDENAVIERALAGNSKVKTAQDQLESALLDLKLNATQFTAPVERRKLEIAVERAELALKTERDRAVVQVMQYLADLAAISSDVEQASLSLEATRQQTEVARVRYEKGMITLIDLLQSENSLGTAEQNLLDAQFRLRDKQQEFRNYIGI